MERWTFKGKVYEKVDDATDSEVFRCTTNMCLGSCRGAKCGIVYHEIGSNGFLWRLLDPRIPALETRVKELEGALAEIITYSKAGLMCQCRDIARAALEGKEP